MGNDLQPNQWINERKEKKNKNPHKQKDGPSEIDAKDLSG